MKILARDEAMQMLNKVPEVTLYFWIIKVMATTVGETGADFLNFDLNFGLTGTSLVMAGLLSVFLFMQLRARKYVPWLYWVNVVLISIVGTLITDNLVDNFGGALETTTALFGLALLATFALWYASEKTLSIHSIFTTKRELFLRRLAVATHRQWRVGAGYGNDKSDLSRDHSGLGRFPERHPQGCNAPNGLSPSERTWNTGIKHCFSC